MKRAFFVLGPESSGTRMMARALVLSGCHEEDALDNVVTYPGPIEGVLDDTPDLMVFHRSLPHQWVWVDLRAHFHSFTQNCYDVTPILMVRDFNATVQSQLKRGFVQSEADAEYNICKALWLVSSTFPRFIPVTYEAFCGNIDFRRWLFEEKLELPMTTIQIYEANGQYY